MPKPEPIRRGEIKGVGTNPSHINFDQLKQQLDSGAEKGKSPFSNFFDTLKPQEPASHKVQENSNHQE